MRNRRGALWALAFAGAAYAWQNRAKLAERFGRSNPPRTPQALPDYGEQRDRDYTDQQQDRGYQKRDPRFGGSDL